MTTNKKTSEYYKWIGTRHFTYVNNIEVDEVLQERLDLSQHEMDEKMYWDVIGLFTYVNGSTIFLMKDGTFRHWYGERTFSQEFKTLDETEIHTFKKLHNNYKNTL